MTTKQTTADRYREAIVTMRRSLALLEADTYADWTTASRVIRDSIARLEILLKGLPK